MSHRYAKEVTIPCRYHDKILFLERKTKPDNVAMYKFHDILSSNGMFSQWKFLSLQALLV